MNLKLSRMIRRLGMYGTALALVLVCCSCGTIRETLPARSAQEQLLISTAADRAIRQLPADIVAEKKVFLELTNLEAFDKAYAIERLRKEIGDKKGIMATAADQADVVIEVASGGLSVDMSNHLLGIPALPLPIPTATTLKFPEIPLLKRAAYYGRAKILLNVIDPKTNKSLVSIGPMYGRVKDVYWWFFFVGPFRFSDLPEGAQ